jgi:DNA-binding FadR family transcriptional regulator
MSNVISVSATTVAKVVLLRIRAESGTVEAGNYDSGLDTQVVEVGTTAPFVASEVLVVRDLYEGETAATAATRAEQEALALSAPSE